MYSKHRDYQHAERMLGPVCPAGSFTTWGAENAAISAWTVTALNLVLKQRLPTHTKYWPLKWPLTMHNSTNTNFCPTLKHWAVQLSCLYPSESLLSRTQSVVNRGPNIHQKRKEKEYMEVKYATSIWIKKQYFTENQWKKSIKLHEIRDQKPLSLN